jgi:hypothetical protein
VVSGNGTEMVTPSQMAPPWNSAEAPAVKNTTVCRLVKSIVYKVFAISVVSARRGAIAVAPASVMIKPRDTRRLRYKLVSGAVRDVPMRNAGRKVPRPERNLPGAFMRVNCIQLPASHELGQP